MPMDSLGFIRAKWTIFNRRLTFLPKILRSDGPSDKELWLGEGSCCVLVCAGIESTMESDVMCGYPPSMSIFSLPDDNGSMSPVRYLVFDKIQWQDELVEHTHRLLSSADVLFSRSTSWFQTTSWSRSLFTGSRSGAGNWSLSFAEAPEVFFFRILIDRSHGGWCMVEKKPSEGYQDTVPVA